jgi:hypothetical protein
VKILFAKQAYESRSKPLMAQRCINLYMEPAPEGAISDFALFGTPGLVLFVDLGSSPIWGMHVMGAYLFVVSGNNVYAIDSSSGSTNLGSIGTVSNVVLMANNGTNVIILLESGAAYLATSSTLTQITDGDYDDSSSVTVLDSFAIFTKLNSAQFQISALGDASAYDALDIATVEGISGNLVRAIAFRGECWMFKEFSTEVYYNSGAGDFPFIPIGSASMQRGCAAKRSVAVDSDHIAWLGDDRIVYIATDYHPERISTFGIEKEIESYSTISDAEGFIYTQEGHKFYVLTFPTESVTWVYDITVSTPEERIWHQRQSFGKGRWRATSYAFFNGMKLVGDFETGKIYSLDLDTYDENGETLQALATCPPIYKDGQRLTHDRIQIQFDTGVGLTSGQGSDPQCMLRFSDDGGYTWSNERTKTIGKIGEYKDRVVFRKNGQARERIYEINITDPVKRNITRADADIRVGSV